MGATLDALRQLQEIETQLRSIRGRIDAKHRSVRILKRRLATLEREAADNHDQIQQAKAQADKLELNRSTHEDHITKLREQLNQAKTNKEYAAILVQINTDKANTLKLEDSVLAALTQIDKLTQQGASQQATIEKERTRLTELESSAGEFEASLSDQLGDLESRRQTAADEIPPQALQQFERACDAHEGEGLAMIKRTHPKRAEYTCSGCNMSLTLETVNALQTRDQVQMCQTCSRILYLDASSGMPVA